MAKSWTQYLDAHENDAEAAGKAAVADIAKRENQNAAARAFRRAYSPLIESLKLPADVDTDSEAEAQTLAARALEGLTQPDPGEDTGGAAAALLGALLDRLGIDADAFDDALGKLPEDASEAQIMALLDTTLEPVTKPLGEVTKLKREANLTQAAQALGKPLDALAEILDGKTLEKRTVKAEDGTESEQWGIPGEGEAFKPLSELRSIQLLGSAPAQPDKPVPAPLPTGQRGGSTPAPKTVEQRTAEVKREISI